MEPTTTGGLPVRLCTGWAARLRKQREQLLDGGVARPAAERQVQENYYNCVVSSKYYGNRAERRCPRWYGCVVWNHSMRVNQQLSRQYPTLWRLMRVEDSRRATYRPPIFFALVLLHRRPTSRRFVAQFRPDDVRL